MPPPEENADLNDFTPERAHLLLRGVYVDYPHNNDGSHLDRGVPDNAICHRCWRLLAAQLNIWYATPSVALGRRFMAIMAAEWWEVLGRSWNCERPLVFAHVVPTKTLGVRRAKEIWEPITRWVDVWDRGLYAGLVGDVEAEGASR